MFRLNVRSWQWFGTSAQQSVGDHVNTGASSRRSNQPVATEAAAASGHVRPPEAPGKIVREVKDNFLHTVSDYNTVFGRFRCAGLLFQPISINKEASGIRDTSFQNVMKRDADLHKYLYASVMLFDGAAMFQEIGGHTAEYGT